MGTIKLCILDAHRSYAEKLMDYLNRHQEKIPFEPRLFTSRDTLGAYLEKYAVDILLLGDEEAASFDQNRVKLLVRLVDESTKAVAEDGIYSIRRYQSMENIQRELLQIYFTEHREEDFFQPVNESLRLVTVFSPSGGSGVSLFSKKLAQVCGRCLAKESGVLHICMDFYEGSPGEDGFSKLDYYISQGKKNLALCLQGLVRREQEIDILSPPEDFQEMISFGREKMERLIGDCLEKSSYQLVIMDLGILTEGTLYAMEQSHMICVPQVMRESGLCDNLEGGWSKAVPQICEETVGGQRKMDVFRNQMKHQKKEALLNKTRQVQIPWFSGRDEEGQIQDLDVEYEKILLPFVQELIA